MYTATQSLLLAASLVPTGALALKSVFSSHHLSQLNDWTRPCTSGKCAFSSGDGVHTAYNTFIVSGSSAAISDLTEAAGWRISGCSPEWSDGPITVDIVCEGDDEQMAQCASLFEGDAIDTIVRLPADCGTGPFARIASITTASSKFRRGPETHRVTLDYDFAAITHDRGEVDFAVATSNSEELGDSLMRTNHLLSSFVKRNTSDVLLPRWEKTHTFDVPPLKVDQSFNLFSTSIDCPAPAEGGAGFSASVSVDAAVKVDAQVAFGFTVAGKIFPPSLTRVQVIGHLNGEAGADFTVQAHAKGVFDTGSIPIWDAGLPGASIPGILSIGPSFGIHGQLSAEVGVEAIVKTGVKYNFPQLKMAFPQDSGENFADAVQVNTPFTLSLDPTVTATGKVHAAIIPRIDLGVKILSGLAEAVVFLDLEAAADLKMNIEGKAAVDGSLGASGATDGNASASASGCAGLVAGVHVNAGARGAIKPIFDKDITFDLFDKEFNVFDKCFGASTDGSAPARKREYVPFSKRSSVARRDLICPNLSLPALAEVFNF